MIKITDGELIFAKKWLEIRVLGCCREHVNGNECFLRRLQVRTRPDDTGECFAVYVVTLAHISLPG